MDQFVLGLDPSVSRTGYAILWASAPHFGTVFMAGTIKAPDEKGISRIVHMRQQLRVLTANVPGKLAMTAIEGYAYGNANSLATLVELGTAFRLHLVDTGLPFITPQPTQVKKFVQMTGAGKLKAKVQEIWGWTAPNHDVADAYVLARIALGAVQPKTLVKDYQLDVVASCRAGLHIPA